ncbi:hypothetical protein BAL199_13748 [alpha proteobacterium BAL199]|nr:hypothetical protein BAL199_13748 [alpha proteobacterium BAL199]
MDITSYDQVERFALSEAHSWSKAVDLSPVTFENAGFLSRLHHIDQIKSLLIGFHGHGRWPELIGELDGLRADDVERLIKAITRYVGWYRTLFPDTAVPIPIVDFLAQYVAYTKLRGLPNRANVLEFGSGLGLMVFFMSEDDAVKCFDLVEITQSLFVAQASICSYCYGDVFQNHALTSVQQPDNENIPMKQRGVGIDIPREFRSSLFPWWQVNIALSGRYDGIVSNSNLAEMSASSLDYYLKNWNETLTNAGHILIQDLGSQLNHRHLDVLDAVDKAGYRALARVVGTVGERRFMCENLLLVAESHPDFDVARSVIDGPFLLQDHETVRLVFGLDRPKGVMLSVHDMLRRVVARITGKTSTD